MTERSADWSDWNVRREGYYRRAVRYFRQCGEEPERSRQLAEDTAQDCCALELEAHDEYASGSLRFWRAWRAWRRAQVVQHDARIAERDAQLWHDALLRAVSYAEHMNERGETVYVKTNGLEAVRCY